nr:hypothetical protein [uncultured Draconibacterium sp.]
MVKRFKVIEVNKHRHVLVEATRSESVTTIGNTTFRNEVEPANYRNTGMALCGILKPEQTLDQFKANYKPVGNNPKPRKKSA